MRKRNGACSSLIPFSVKTGCSQFFFYLFRIMYYFNSQHLVSKSPTETVYKSQQFPECKYRGTLVLCNRKTFQLVKIYWWERETAGKSGALGPSQGRRCNDKTTLAKCHKYTAQQGTTVPCLVKTTVDRQRFGTIFLWVISSHLTIWSGCWCASCSGSGGCSGSSGKGPGTRLWCNGKRALRWLVLSGPE